jgi:predicted Holliday junction resolvase-like endonuclease
MEIVVSLLFGIIIGSATTYYFLQKSQQKKTIREYESQIQVLKEQHQQALKEAKNRSLDGSRAVIKGKIAEQLAPVLPSFKYLPSDARFIGDPIDYIVFNGYTDIKDNGGNENNLEVVILDIKTGQASLSQFQQAIARAINAGRVRFEVVRPDTSDQQRLRGCLKSRVKRKKALWSYAVNTTTTAPREPHEQILSQ